MRSKREQWSSGIGFIMAAAGSAIGLGNLWKFPYVAGTSGGAVFLIIYIFFLVILGIPILLSEMAIGRFAGENAVDSCKKLSRKFGFVGALGIAGAFLVLASYGVVGGWVIKYIFKSFSGSGFGTDFFADYTAQPIEPILWTFVFIAINVIIVTGGIAKGIERVSTILLPVLLIFLIGIMIYCLTLPNAAQGVRYFIVPDLSKINSISDLSQIAINAMGQVFFSLSLGMGTLITYGSYLPKSTNLTSSTVTIVTLDTLIAVIAGFAIIPAVFSFGLEVTGGPGLIFQTLPVVFSNIKGGQFISALFFLLVLFAAVTSAISLLEVIVSWFSDKTGLSRKVSSVIAGGAAFLMCIFASLSFGVLSETTIFNMNFFDFLNFAADKIVMPIGGFFMCILVGHIWGIDAALEEISNSRKLKFRLKPLFSAAIKYIAPAMIIVIFISSFF